MRIWLVGGGTAGHALPLTALASELEQAGHQCLIISDHNPAAKSALAGSKWPIRLIHTGKFRRYHKRSWSQRLTDVGTLFANLKDLLFIGAGFMQSIWLLGRTRPDVVFINGGSIGVPVAWACRLFRKPYLIHESDAKAGLANRLIAPGAKRVLLGIPSNLHKGDERYIVTGIPVRPEFKQAKQKTPKEAKQKLELPAERPMVLVTGGSQGSHALNQAILECAGKLVETAMVVHIAGPKHEAAVRAQVKSNFYRVLGFAGQEMADYLQAADVVVARAGASTLADLAFMGKPAIIVPNPLLVGGHQLVNAAQFKDREAVMVLEESAIKDHPQSLGAEIEKLLADEKQQKLLSRNISTLAHGQATAEIARQITEVGEGR